MATIYSNKRKQYARYSNVESLTQPIGTSAKHVSLQRTEQDKLMYSTYTPPSSQAPEIINNVALPDNQELRDFVSFHRPRQGITELTSHKEQENFLTVAPVCVIYLYGQTCEPCKIIGPQFEELSQKFINRPEIAFAKENAHLFINKQVQGVPSFLIYKNGKEAAFFLGDFYKVEPTILDLLKENSPIN